MPTAAPWEGRDTRIRADNDRRRYKSHSSGTQLRRVRRERTGSAAEQGGRGQRESDAHRPPLTRTWPGVAVAAQVAGGAGHWRRGDAAGGGESGATRGLQLQPQQGGRRIGSAQSGLPGHTLHEQCEWREHAPRRLRVGGRRHHTHPPRRSGAPSGAGAAVSQPKTGACSPPSLGWEMCHRRPVHPPPSPPTCAADRERSPAKLG